MRYLCNTGGWNVWGEWFLAGNQGNPQKGLIILAKMLKNQYIVMAIFQHFSFGPPLGNYEKKSCLNKLKFWEASRNQKRSIYWKFKLSISLGTQKSVKTPPAVAKMFSLVSSKFLAMRNIWWHSSCVTYIFSHFF